MRHAPAPVAALAIGLAAAGCGGVQSPLNPAGPQASSIATLTWWFFGICGLVYVVVLAVTIWAIRRPQRPADDLPATARRLGVVITAAVAVTVVTLVALTAASVFAARGLQRPSRRAVITVDVVGHRWWWEFRYHDVTPTERVDVPNELHIPVGVPVVLRAMSRDVIHSFWVPNLLGKRDLTPGMVTHTWIQADTPGTYRGQCAEFCGYQHANMAFLVVAEPMDRFRTWLEAQRRSAPEPATELAQRGHDVFMNGPCVLCHTVRGTIAGSRVGPDLTHVASRQTIAGATIPNTRGHRAGWIADSQSIKPGNRMPPNLLRGEDLQAVLAYLDTLR